MAQKQRTARPSARPRTEDQVDRLALARQRIAAVSPRARLHEVAVVHREVTSDLRSAVTAARVDGMSWAAIGRELKMSPEGARQRYGVAS